MVATDIFGRGIDIERVNIVVNYDMPDSADSYLHRVGRAGRFGTKGLAVTFVSSAEDSEILNKVQERFEVNITELPEHIETTTYSTSPRHAVSSLTLTRSDFVSIAACLSFVGSFNKKICKNATWFHHISVALELFIYRLLFSGMAAVV